MNAMLQAYRKQLLVGVPSAFFIIILFCYFFGGRYVSTDDAYMKAARVAVSSNVSGQVIKIYVHDNQVVRKGDVLFSLDDKPYKIAQDQASAKLTNARLQVESLKATYQQQIAHVQAAQDTLAYQQKEFDRQQKLAPEGIVSQEQLNKVTNNFNNAKQQLVAAQQQLANIAATLGGNPDIPVEEHPTVREAQAQLDKAKLDLYYTNILAPIDGIVAKVEQLQIGDYANVGAPVFSLVSNKNIWIEANFKETQIAKMRPGQKVSINLDAYPGVKLVGHVMSTSPGTGSTFSLLPPENATGNWVKIVQRVPVRIAIDNIEKIKQVSSGLSVDVTVDTEHCRLFS